MTFSNSSCQLRVLCSPGKVLFPVEYNQRLVDVGRMVKERRKLTKMHSIDRRRMSMMLCICYMFTV